MVSALGQLHLSMSGQGHKVCIHARQCDSKDSSSPTPFMAGSSPQWRVNYIKQQRVPQPYFTNNPDSADQLPSAECQSIGHPHHEPGPVNKYKKLFILKKKHTEKRRNKKRCWQRSLLLPTPVSKEHTTKQNKILFIDHQTVPGRCLPGQRMGEYQPHSNALGLTVQNMALWSRGKRTPPPIHKQEADPGRGNGSQGWKTLQNIEALEPRWEEPPSPSGEQREVGGGYQHSRAPGRIPAWLTTKQRGSGLQGKALRVGTCTYPSCMCFLGGREDRNAGFRLGERNQVRAGH